MELSEHNNQLIWRFQGSLQWGFWTFQRLAVHSRSAHGPASRDFFGKWLYSSVPHPSGIQWIEWGSASDHLPTGLDLLIRAQIAIYNVTVGLENFMQQAVRISQPHPLPVLQCQSPCKWILIVSHAWSVHDICHLVSAYIVVHRGISLRPAPLTPHAQWWVLSKLSQMFLSYHCWQFNYSPHIISVSVPALHLPSPPKMS